MSDFGLKIGIDGEKQFKQALREIGQSFKVLGSEMTLAASQFDKNDKSVAALTARNTILDKSISSQKDKIETLKAALDNAASSFGENDRRTQEWQAKLNDAQAELNNMERELKNNAKAISDVERGFNDAGEKLDEFGNVIEETTEKASIFGDVLKASLAADAIKAGLSAIIDGIKKITGAIVDFVGNNIIKGGFERALKIEGASFKLQGLGHDAKSVARILDEDVTNAVKGTAFALDAMAGVAASSLAAGIPEGKHCSPQFR